MLPDVTVSDDVSTEIEPSQSAAPTPDAPAVPEVVTPVAADPLVPAPASASATEAAQAAYAANYKYTVKGQEKEIDEMFRPLIKDADTEKKIKELFEKADGLESVKGDRESIKKEYNGFKEQVIPHLEVLHKFTAMRDQGNLGAAFKVAGISDEQLFKHCIQLLEIQQNPAQAQLFEQHTNASLQQIEMQNRLARYEQQEQQGQAQTFEQNIESAIGGQKDLASQVDQRLGKVGSFKEEVIAHGIYQFNRGVQLSPEQAVEAVANKYKPFITPTAPTIQSAPAAHVPPATIPSVGSSNVSVISQRPKSIEDLKKIERELVG